MIATRVIPTLLFRSGQLVKGPKFNCQRRVGSPRQAVSIHDLRNVDELILLNIDSQVDLETIKSVTDIAFMPLTIGGGVKSVADIRALLNAGADKVSIRTCVELIPEASKKFGNQCIVASIDHHEDEDVTERARSLENDGAGEILLTSIDRDGTFEGYDLRAIESVSRAVSVPVIASGGCGSYEHMAQALSAGAHAIAAGSMFLFTDQTPKGAAEYLASKGFPMRLQ